MESRDFSEGFAAVEKTATARREAKCLPFSGFRCRRKNGNGTAGSEVSTLIGFRRRQKRQLRMKHYINYIKIIKILR